MIQKITPDMQDWFALIHEESNVEQVDIYTVRPDGIKVRISHERDSDEITVQRVAG